MTTTDDFEPRAEEPPPDGRGVRPAAAELAQRLLARLGRARQAFAAGTWVLVGAFDTDREARRAHRLLTYRCDRLPDRWELTSRVVRGEKSRTTHLYARWFPRADANAGAVPAAEVP